MLIERFGGRVGLKCSDDILKELINSFVKERNASFTFNDLYHHLKSKAKANDYLKKESNVVYRSFEFSGDVIESMSKMLWDLIWEKKLMIDFSTGSTYGMQSDKDFRFIPVQDKE